MNQSTGKAKRVSQLSPLKGNHEFPTNAHAAERSQDISGPREHIPGPPLTPRLWGPSVLLWLLVFPYPDQSDFPRMTQDRLLSVAEHYSSPEPLKAKELSFPSLAWTLQELSPTSWLCGLEEDLAAAGAPLSSSVR